MKFEIERAQAYRVERIEQFFDARIICKVAIYQRHGEAVKCNLRKLIVQGLQTRRQRFEWKLRDIGYTVELCVGATTYGRLSYYIFQRKSDRRAECVGDRISWMDIIPQLASHGAN